MDKSSVGTRYEAVRVNMERTGGYEVDMILYPVTTHQTHTHTRPNRSGCGANSVKLYPPTNLLLL